MTKLLRAALFQNIWQQILELLGLRLASDAQHILAYLKSDFRPLEVNHRVVLHEHVHLINAV